MEVAPTNLAVPPASGRPLITRSDKTMVSVNLVQTAGLMYSATGALFVLLALPPLLRARTRFAPTSSRELAIGRATRYDLRFGLVMSAIGAILLTLAAYRFHAPLSLWR